MLKKRQFSGDTLIIASHNSGKVAEISQLLQHYVAHFSSAAEHQLREPEETGTTFIENSRLKAKIAAKASGLPALADDSGLAVNALDGAPGIYSARWAGPNKDFRVAMTRIHDMLEDEEDQSASFICALSLAWPDGHCETVEGTVKGQIIWPPRGNKGFGYDPIFQPKGYTQSFAEMDQTLKQSISHRSDAFKKMIAACFNGG